MIRHERDAGQAGPANTTGSRHERLAARMLLVAALAAWSCDTSVDPVDVPDGSPPDAPRACGPFVDPLAMPGDPIAETYAGTARPFLDTYCTSCHASTLAVPERRGAPVGLDWDIEDKVREHLADIRNSVGQVKTMPPPSAVRPECDERESLVRWIDGGAP